MSRRIQYKCGLSIETMTTQLLTAVLAVVVSVCVLCDKDETVDRVSDMDEVTEISKIMATSYCKCAGEAITNYDISISKAELSVPNWESLWKI